MADHISEYILEDVIELHREHITDWWLSHAGVARWKGVAENYPF